QSSTLSNNLYFDAYDNTGGLTLGSSPLTVNIDTERENPDSNIFELDAGVITINVSDKFMFMYRVSIDNVTGSSRSDNINFLEFYNGSSWIEVDGFRGHGYNRQSSEGMSTITVAGIIDVESGDQFRIRTFQDSGSGTLETIEDGSSITIFSIRNSGSGPIGPAGADGADGADGPEGSKGDPGTASDFINIYNSDDGNVTITDNSDVNIPFDEIRNESGTIFTLYDDYTLEISATDDFMIQYIVSLEQVSGNNRTTWQSWLEEDSGSGFVEIPGTRGSGYSRQNSDGENTVMGQTIVSVTGSSTFRVTANDVSTTNRDHQAIPNGCSLVAYTLRGGEQGPAGPAGSGTSTAVAGVEGNGNNGEIAFWTGGSSSETITGDSDLNYDSNNNHLGIGVSSPSYNLDVSSDINIGQNGSSGTLNLFSENGGTDHRISFSSSNTMSEDTDYILPVEQGESNSSLMNDGSGNLFWGTGSSVASSLRFPIRFTSTSDITVVEDDSYIICDNDGTTINVNLPDASGLSGKVYFIKKVSPNGATHIVTIVPNGSDEIDGAADYDLTKEFDAVMIISDGISTWHLMSRINN
ncbi:hypothetical protein OAQ99_07555, partial [Candidatus Kapabacteria bacterium]|nr:hypothetical protein [Candidatus Kapabacteria bacterium]